MIRWSWEEKVGEVTAINHDGKEYKLSLYQGNAYMVFIYEKDDYYHVHCFWVDEEHMKNMLGITKGHKENCHLDIVKWSLSRSKCKYFDKITRALLKAKWATFTLELY